MAGRADLMDLFDESKDFFFCIGKKINDELKSSYSTNESRMMIVLKKIGRAKLSDLTEFFGAKPFICMRLGMLERKKFVAREVDMADKRNVYYHVAPKGEKYIEQVTASIKDNLDKIFGSLDDKDIQVLIKSLKEMNTVLSKVA